MTIISNKILLISLGLSATAPAVAFSQQQDVTKLSVQGDSLQTADASSFSKHQPMTESTVKLKDVVVTGLTGSQKLKQSPAPVSIISARQLEAQPSSNIIDAIAHQPGISQITTGNGISKPVIRGLGYNRVVVVNDGIRQEGQQWGDEHGIEVDPYSVHSVEILKGPSSLMYGSDAMAGVIIFRPAPTLAEGAMSANVTSGYQTNNGLFDYSLNYAGNLHGWVWNTRYSGKMAHAYKNKWDGYVFGSSYGEQAFSQLLGLNHRHGFTHLTLSCYHSTPGIVEGERDEETGELEVPDGYSLKGYGKPMPYQQIHHYKAVLDNSLYLGDGFIKWLVGYQQNRRQEFEEVENPNECGLDFMLHTVNYDVHYLSPEVSGWKFSTGINGMWQQSLNKGSEYLIPAYRLFDFGVFATVSKEVGRLNVSGGLRYDHRHLHSDALWEEEEDSGDAHGLVNSERGASDGDKEILRFQPFKRNFGSMTASLGLTYELSQALNLKLNVSRGFRAPNISELASNGVHEGTQRYELGNIDLKPEHSWQMDFGLDYTSSIVSAQLALFVNRIDNYIYSRKLTTYNDSHACGQVDALTNEQGGEVLMDGVPAYRFSSGDARIWGGEARVDVHPLPRLHIGNSFSYVNSVQLHQPSESKYLPLTPAPRWQGDVKYEFVCGGRTFDNLFLKFAVDCDLRQNHYYAAYGTETATPSYTLLNLYAGSDIKLRGKRILSLYLSGENLADRAYQSHLSRLKYLDVNQKTGRRGVYNMGRNFTMKVVVPIDL